MHPAALRPGDGGGREPVAATRTTVVCFDIGTDAYFRDLLRKWNLHESGCGSLVCLDDPSYASAGCDTTQPGVFEERVAQALEEADALLVLVGEFTRREIRFVSVQLETARGLDIPVICVNLNDARRQDRLCPPSLKTALALHVAFHPRILRFALASWPASHARHRDCGNAGPYHYDDAVYRSICVGS